MKRIIALSLLILFIFTISLSTYAMTEKEDVPVLSHSFKDKEYKIFLGYNFYIKESIFEKYEADITFQNYDNYEIVYISIEKNLLYECNDYIVETYIKEDKKILHALDFISKFEFDKINIKKEKSNLIANQVNEAFFRISYEYTNNPLNIIDLSNVINNNVKLKDNGFGFEDISGSGETLEQTAYRLSMTDKELDVYDPYESRGDSNTGRYVESSIIKLIPKEYFFKTGFHSYIGKEFGYFIISTPTQNNAIFKCDVILFDIEYENLLGGANTLFRVSLIPKFAFEYDCYDKSQGTFSESAWNSLFGSNYTKIVVRNSDISGYALSDIKMTAVLRNRYAVNQEDSGYNINTDQGDYFNLIMQEINLATYSSNDARKVASSLLGIVSLAIGQVSKVGSTISFLLDTCSIIDGMVDKNKDTNEAIHLQYNFSSSKASQINKYNALLKMATSNFYLDSSQINKSQMKITYNSFNKMTCVYGVVNENSSYLVENDCHFGVSLNLFYSGMTKSLKSAESMFFINNYKRD
jgi:hypothetical protein